MRHQAVGCPRRRRSGWLWVDLFPTNEDSPISNLAGLSAREDEVSPGVKDLVQVVHKESSRLGYSTITLPEVPVVERCDVDGPVGGCG